VVVPDNIFNKALHSQSNENLDDIIVTAQKLIDLRNSISIVESRIESCENGRKWKKFKFD
jgi:hypothetical protein